MTRQYFDLADRFSNWQAVFTTKQCRWTGFWLLRLRAYPVLAKMPQLAADDKEHRDKAVCYVPTLPCHVPEEQYVNASFST